MIGLDTNVLLRYLVQDDAHQSAAATRVFERLTPASPGFLSLVVLVEAAWVLQRTYGVTVAQWAAIVDDLLRTDALVLEREAIVSRAAYEAARYGAGFADAVVVALGAAAGCGSTLTFDRRAARLPGFRLL